MKYTLRLSVFNSMRRFNKFAVQDSLRYLKVLGLYEDFDDVET